MTASSEVHPDRVDRRPVRRLAQDATESLAALGDAASALRGVDDETPPAKLAAFLEGLGRHAEQFEERFARVASHLAAPVGDIADEVIDAAETLATRWDGLVAARQHALIDAVLARRSELAILLNAAGRAATPAPPARSSGPTRPSSAPPAKDAAKAWEAWTQDLSSAARDVFMRLSQSWIEGTGAKLARDERSPSSTRSNVTEVTARVRHHLVLLAEAGSVPYLDALATARRRVTEELHG